MAFFKALRGYIVSPAWYGCPFINVASEYPELEYTGHEVALEHKQSALARFNQLAEEAGTRQPALLANALLLLMDGAYMAACMYRASSSNPAADVAKVAKHLNDAQC